MLHCLFLLVALFGFAPVIPSKAPHIEVDHQEFVWFFDNRPEGTLVFKPKTIPKPVMKNIREPQIHHRTSNRHH